MMPLWTMATSLEKCGCALVSFGTPWVAQRVWPMPIVPSSGSSPSRFSRLTSLPSARRRPSRPWSIVATPAESYPRYSSRLSASTISGATGARPTIPTIPHIFPNPSRSAPIRRIDSVPETYAEITYGFSSYPINAAGIAYNKGLIIRLLARLGRQLLAQPPAEPFLVLLPRAAEGKGIVGHVRRNHAAGSDVGPLADRHRCDQGGIRSHECAGPDLGMVLGIAVIVAGDRAGAEIGLRADMGVAHI